MRLIDAEPVGERQTSRAECRIARGDRAGDDAEHGEHRADAGHEADADVIDDRASAASLHRSCEAARAVIERDAGRRPDEGDDAFGNHGAVENRTAEALVLEAASHDWGLCGMEAGASAAGDRDEHQRPDRHLLRAERMQVRKRHVRHRVAADAEQHANHDAERHDDEAGAENRIEASNQRVNRQQRREEVVEQHARQHVLDGDARELCDEADRARHEDSTDEHEQHDRKHAHDEEHHGAHVVADDLRDALAILAQRNHAGQVIMHAACEDGTKDNPEIDARAPDGAAKRTENRAEACDVQELDHEDLPCRQRDVVDAVVMTNGRCGPVRRAEDMLDDLAIGEIAYDKCTESK